MEDIFHLFVENPANCMTILIPAKVLVGRMYTDKKRQQEVLDQYGEDLDGEFLKSHISSNEKLRNLIRRRILGATDTSKILTALAAHDLF